MTEEPIFCRCGDQADPEDVDSLCWFCRFWNGPDAHGPFEPMTLEDAADELRQQINR